MENHFQTKQVLEEVCDIHSCNLWMTLVSIKGRLEKVEQCPECTKIAIGVFGKKLEAESEINSKLADTYAVFNRDSLVSDKLTVKSLETYEIKAEIY
ncbi:hypothetical protein FRX54_00535 [Streptococcus sp. sy004]|nr:hypothetical protein FRX54_00535 [Streptococcus sp. sy004]